MINFQHKMTMKSPTLFCGLDTFLNTSLWCKWHKSLFVLR